MGHARQLETCGENCKQPVPTSHQTYVFPHAGGVQKGSA